MTACTCPVLAAVSVAFLLSGSAVNGAGRTPVEQREYDFVTQRAIEQAAFFHPGCAPAAMTILRLGEDRRDLEVWVGGQERDTRT